MKTVKQLLIATKSLIETRGWCQGMYSDANQRICLTEGLYRAGKQLNFEDYDELQKVVGSFVGLSFTGWNDAPGRTKEEVLEMLDKAIASC